MDVFSFEFRSVDEVEDEEVVEEEEEEIGGGGGCCCCCCCFEEDVEEYDDPFLPFFPGNGGAGLAPSPRRLGRGLCRIGAMSLPLPSTHPIPRSIAAPKSSMGTAL